MASNNTITINGREYDAKTGLPVASTGASRPEAARPKTASRPAAKRPAPVASPKTPASARGVQAAKAVHSSAPKRSETLRRQAVKKPVAPTKVVRKTKPSGTRHMDIARSTQVTKFAPHPEAAVAKKAPTSAATHIRPAQTKKAVQADAPAVAHPIARRAVLKQAQTKTKPVAKTVSAKEVKEAQIKKALSAKAVPQSKKQAKVAKQSSKKKAPSLWKKRTIILTGIAVVALLAVLAATHIFPGLSVQVASIQSGVNASYPKYIPDGYSLSQPIRTGDGKIAITFKSNSNDTSYTLTQSSSSWDSTAVLDNLVKKEADNNYVTTRERGLTIYTYQTHAAWVNGGILYTINGSADLSGDQIRKIATSL